MADEDARGAAHKLPIELPRRRRGAPIVPLSVRVLPSTAELIDEVAAATGATKNEVVEAAILAAYRE